MLQVSEHFRSDGGAEEVLSVDDSVVLQSFFRGHSGLAVDAEQLLEEVPALGRDLRSSWLVEVFESRLDVVGHLEFVVVEEGGLSENQEEADDAAGPNVAFLVVLLREDLGSHVDELK